MSALEKEAKSKKDCNRARRYPCRSRAKGEKFGACRHAGGCSKKNCNARTAQTSISSSAAILQKVQTSYHSWEDLKGASRSLKHSGHQDYVPEMRPYLS